MNPDLPKLLHGTRWLNLLERGGWVFASRRPAGAAVRTDAVNVIAIHEEGARRRLVVIEEWRTVVQAWEFALPAGLVEDGEPLSECAARELEEESGLKVSWNGPTSGRLFTSAGMTDETYAFAFVGCAGTPALEPGVGGEKIRVHLLDREGCRALLARNRAGEAALSGRLWPWLFSLAETGRIGAYEFT